MIHLINETSNELIVNNEKIEIKRLTTGYIVKGTQHLLQKNINASVNPGEITILLGVNGSGKSTLMRTVSGYQPALEGEIILNGIPLHAYSQKEIARKIAVIFTGSIDDNYLTAGEITAMGRYPQNPFGSRLSADDKKIVNEALTMVEMSAFAAEPFVHLSDGEKQRVLIARALAQQTPYILMDEPAAFIDMPGKIAIMELLKEIAHNHRKGILLATHDIDLALQYADRIWLLGKNLPFKKGIPEDIALSGNLRDYFHHEGIVFNVETGKFEKTGKKTTNKIIGVPGKKTAVFLLSKALERKGYKVIGMEKGDLKRGILCKINEFVVLDESKEVCSCKRIEEVLDYLKPER